jgi:hypothetical protein
LECTIGEKLANLEPIWRGDAVGDALISPHIKYTPESGQKKRGK